MKPALLARSALFLLLVGAPALGSVAPQSPLYARARDLITRRYFVKAITELSPLTRTGCDATANFLVAAAHSKLAHLAETEHFLSRALACRLEPGHERAVETLRRWIREERERARPTTIIAGTASLPGADQDSFASHAERAPRPAPDVDLAVETPPQ